MNSQRKQLIQEQNSAFEESLKVDQEKEKQKKLDQERDLNLSLLNQETPEQRRKRLADAFLSKNKSTPIVNKENEKESKSSIQIPSKQNKENVCQNIISTKPVAINETPNNLIDLTASPIKLSSSNNIPKKKEKRKQEAVSPSSEEEYISSDESPVQTNSTKKKMNSSISKSVLPKPEVIDLTSSPLKPAPQQQTSKKLITKLEDTTPIKKSSSYISDNLPLHPIFQKLDTQFLNPYLQSDLPEMFRLPRELASKLYPYQKEGVNFLWQLYKKGTGGILGDDMGLGKTVQSVAFFIGLFFTIPNKIKRILVVSDSSLLENWKTEFSKWSEGYNISSLSFYGSNSKKLATELESLIEKGGVCFTTYGKICPSKRSTEGQTAFQQFLKSKWDVVLLDEGHKIKNHSKFLSISLRAIKSRSRFILTGTPIQNNLKELWSLFDYVCEGKLLGDIRTFSQLFEQPIIKGLFKNSNSLQKEVAYELQKQLLSRLCPHFLRRERCQLFNCGQTPNSGIGKANNGSTSSLLSSRLNDFVVYLPLTNTQKKLYLEFLKSDPLKQVTTSDDRGKTMTCMIILKTICDHYLLLESKPQFLSYFSPQVLVETGFVCQNNQENSIFDLSTEPVFYQRKIGNGNLIKSLPGEIILQICSYLPLSDLIQFIKLFRIQIHNKKTSWKNFLIAPQIESLQYSVKLKFVADLLPKLHAEKHKVLIFSKYLAMLDLVEFISLQNGYSYFRIDGKLTNVQLRQSLVDRFNSDASIFCLLMTTKVGGIGLNITGADRVILIDPSWNPSDDNQAVARSYRLGQTKNVIVYRLISISTIEEKIYRRQVFKGTLIQSSLKNEWSHNYFSEEELRSIFSFDDAETSKTQQELADLHSSQRESDPELEKHVAFLKSIGCVGISDHNLLHTKVQGEDAPTSSTPYAKQNAMLAMQTITENPGSSAIRNCDPFDQSLFRAPRKLNLDEDSEGSSEEEEIESEESEDEEIKVLQMKMKKNCIIQNKTTSLSKSSPIISQRNLNQVTVSSSPPVTLPLPKVSSPLPSIPASESRNIHSSGRRQRKKWTPAEIAMLEEGVKKFGTGKWVQISEIYDFGDRIPTDLKDKWRNLNKS